MNKTYVLYHGNCYDGFGAAWAAYQFFKPREDDVEYIPVYYGRTMPKMDHWSKVYILDFSYPKDILLDLAKTRTVQLIDHHQTALPLKELDFCYVNLEHSGAVLTWKHFFKIPPVPMLLTYVEDYDMWWHKQGFTHEINAAIRSYPMKFDVWDKLTIPKLFEEGKIVLRMKDVQIQRMLEEIQWREIAGYVVPVVNASMHFSEVASELLKRYPLAQFGAYYYDRHDVRQWGLRSVDFDVSEIAKKFGGGGHKNSAGFTTDFSYLPKKVD